jgi:hypothetical protein
MTHSCGHSVRVFWAPRLLDFLFPRLPTHAVRPARSIACALLFTLRQYTLHQKDVGSAKLMTYLCSPGGIVRTTTRRGASGPSSCRCAYYGYIRLASLLTWNNSILFAGPKHQRAAVESLSHNQLPAGFLSDACYNCAIF